MGCETSKNQPEKLNLKIKKSEDQEIVDFKIVFLGESGVGKSSITQRYCNNQFSHIHQATIGVAYMQNTVYLRNGLSITLHLWDTCGEERFRSIAPLYYKDAKAMIFVYDISDVNSFDSLANYWLQQLEFNKQDDKVVLGLIGNKCDVDSQYKLISPFMINSLAQQHNMIYSEVSAKTGQSINEFFYEICEQLYKNYCL